jgi:hypothetical protein
MEDVLAFARQHEHFFPFLKFDDADRARLAADRLFTTGPLTSSPLSNRKAQPRAAPVGGQLDIVDCGAVLRGSLHLLPLRRAGVPVLQTMSRGRRSECPASRASAMA